jgi:DNA repair photolyase
MAQRVLLPPKPFEPFTPKRVFVNIKCVGLDQTEHYLEKIRKANPIVEIEEYEGRFQYPTGMTPAEMFHYMKDTILISERSDAPFFETFPAPGNCVENLGTMAKPCWQCVGKCHFCYLMVTEPHEHYFYTNLDRFEDELATSPFAHRIILTLWTLASQIQNKVFPKVPYHLCNTAEDIRKEVVAIGVLSDEDAKEYLHQHLQGTILERLKTHWTGEEPNRECPYTAENIERTFMELSDIYDQCAKLRFSISPSEYADIVAVDHLTGHLDYFMTLLPRFPDVSLSIRTKFANVDGLLKHDGMNRVKFQMNFNTPYAIQEFEPNAPPLEDRIAALRKMQEAKGYKTEVIIEPIIPYAGHRQDYIELVETILAGVHKDRISAFSIGAARYKISEGKILPQVAVRNFPNTKLFVTELALQKAERKDGRQRYPLDWRVSIYKVLIDTFKKQIPDASIKIGADVPEVWSRLNLDVRKYMADSVIQYEGDKNVMTTTENNTDPTYNGADESGTKKIEAQSDAHSVVIPPAQSPQSKTQEELEASASIKYQIAAAGIGSTTGKQAQKFSDRAQVLELDNLLQQWKPLNGKSKSEWNDLFAKKVIPALVEAFYTPVKICGWIGDISQPLAVKARNVKNAKASRGFQITIVDEDSQHLQTLIIPITEDTNKYYRIKAKNKRVVFCGAIVPIDSARKQDRMFYLWDIIPYWTAEDLIGIELTDSNNEFKKIIEQVGKTPYGIFNYIKEQIVEKIGIRGLNSIPELDRCLEVMILQAFSDGMNSSPKYSNRIHTLVMSTSGQGKKFLHETASILNPSYAQASSVDGKINVAGLIGSDKSRGKSNISAPGLLPLNSGGVVSFQDIHQLKAYRSAVLAALSEVMEDGQVKDSNSPRVTHEAVTAIHVDMNKATDVAADVVANPYADINIPYNIISRFDYIVQLPADIDRILKTLRETYGKGREMSSYAPEVQNAYWEYELKRIVAHLRTYWHKVMVPPEVETYIVDKIQSEFKIDGSTPQTLSKKVVQDNINRVTRSVFKFIKALACVDRQEIATTEHVDRVLTYVRDKIKFLEVFSGENNDTSKSKRILNKAYGSNLFTNIFKKLEPGYIGEEKIGFVTDAVLNEYTSIQKIVVTKKNKMKEKTDLTKLLEEHYGILVEVRHIKKAKKSDRCYMLNRNQAKQFGVDGLLKRTKIRMHPTESKKKKEKTVHPVVLNTRTASTKLRKKEITIHSRLRKRK